QKLGLEGKSLEKRRKKRRGNPKPLLPSPSLHLFFP
uniref:Uncharacterized protein n=1 Tax=Aegilops tauschii subsp. strangulata TaxID=200361 RepID=A0A453J4Q4_AEGTS